MPAREQLPPTRKQSNRSLGGRDAIRNTRQQLYERARDLGVTGGSRMNKRELAREIARKLR